MNNLTLHPSNLYIPMLNQGSYFRPWGYQEYTMKLIDNYDLVLVNSTRQMGMTTMLNFSCLKYAVENPDQTVMITRHNFRAVKESLQAIGKDWTYHLIDGDGICRQSLNVRKIGKDTLEFENGSIILGNTFDPAYMRGLRLDALFVDDPFTISHTLGEKFRVEALPTFKAIGTKIVMGGLLAQKKGLFYDLHFDPDFVTHYLPWHLHPDRNKAWRKQMIENSGKELFVDSFHCMGSI